MSRLPEGRELTIGLAHPVYRLGDEFRARSAPFSYFEAKTSDELTARIHEADVLVVSGLWRNELLARAGRLRFIQSVSAGTDQFDRELIRAGGVRLASAQGANERAVAQHAMALILSLARHIHHARDRQHRAEWAGMIADRALREQELTGRTLVVVGLGGIGTRLAHLAKAFDMRVIGVRRQAAPAPGVDRVVPPDALLDVLSEADFVALTCPLTSETEGMIGGAQIAAMKPSAYLVNVARGRVVDEGALIEALNRRSIAGAGLDCFHEEPLPSSSPLWGMTNTIITPHRAGETQGYEAAIIDLLLENMRRLNDGEALRNQIV